MDAASLPVGSALSRTVHLKTLLCEAKRCDLRRGEFLFRQGYPSIFLCWIAHGGVLLLRGDERGAEVALDWCGGGALCGLEDVICRQPYSLSARATTRTTAYCVSTEYLHTVLRRDVATAAAVMEYLGTRMRLAAEHMDLLSFGTVTERLRVVLRRLVVERPSSAPAVLPLTQSDLAALIGVSRQSVNQAFLALQNRCAAKPRGRSIHIVNPGLL